MRKLFLALILLAVASNASAQTSLTADRIYLGVTGCRLSTGAGAPTGGAPCDWYLDTSTGHVWNKVGATWVNVSTTVAVSRGGTGVVSIPTGGVVYGNGTGPVGVTASPAANSVLGVAGGVPIFTTGPSVVSLSASSTVTTPRLDTAAGSLTLAPLGSVVLDPGSRTVLPGSNFGISIGAPEQQFLALHLGELWASNLVAQNILATIGGRVMIAPTTILSADLSTSATSITVKANTLRNGDRVYLQTAPGGVPQIEWMAVTSAASGSGPYTYTVTRDLDGSGANLWYSGDAVLDTGTTGNGFIDLFALTGVLTGYGPTIVGQVRTGTGFNAIAPRWAIGNLRDIGYGHTGSDTFGVAFGNPQGAYAYHDDVNGLVMGGPGGVRVHISPAGAASFSGDGNGVTNIDGGHINANTITANQIAAGAITADKFASGSGTNVVENSECRASAAGWNPSYSTGLPTYGFFYNASYALDGQSNTCYAWTQTGINPGTVMGFEGQRYPAEAGKTYEASGYLGSVTTNNVGSQGYAAAYLQFIDASGNQISAPEGTHCPLVNSGGTQLSLYCRSFVIATAPAGTVNVRPYFYQQYNTAQAAAYFFLVRAFVAEAKPNQTQPSEWGPAGVTEITGGTIRTGAIVAAHLAANSVTANAIAAGTITGDKIAANTITVGMINATGMGDNLVKNGAFEPNVGKDIGDPSALSGWAIDATATSSPEPLRNVCCGQSGGGTLLLDTNNNGILTTVYQAFPIDRSGGGTYLVSFWVYAAPSANAMHVRMNEYDGQTGGVRYVLLGTTTYPDIASTRFQYLAANLATVNGWQHFTFTYTPTPTALMASLTVMNFSGAPAGSPYTPIYLDDVEIVRQIGPGHIRANSITADRIAASTITGDKIAAATITGGNIAADTITGAHIAAGTITAADIAAGSISADRLNVSTLSAISANLGTVTAGDITGVNIHGNTISGGSISGTTVNGSTIYGGGGNQVRIDVSGLTITSGDSSGDARIKLGPLQVWGNSNNTFIDNGHLEVYGNGSIDGTGFVGGALTANTTLHVVQNAIVDGAVSVVGEVNAGGAIRTSSHFYLNNGGGYTIVWSGGLPNVANGGTQAYIDTTCNCLTRLASSERYKENFRRWTPDDPFAILSVPLYRFDFKPDLVHPKPATDRIGLKAEDLYKVAPGAVALDREGRPDGIQDDTLHAYFLAVMRAAETQILELQKKVAALETAARKGKQ